MIDRANVLNRCIELPGWMWPSELEWLYDTFKMSLHHAEVGAFCGRSLFASCAGMGACARVWAIDPIDDDGFGVPSRAWIEKVFRATSDEIRGMGIELTHLRMKSMDAARLLYHGGVKLDSVFIDAIHDYEGCAADIESWRPLVKPGGILAGHDYWAKDPGVMEAVNELCRGFAIVAGTRIWCIRI